MFVLLTIHSVTANGEFVPVAACLTGRLGQVHQNDAVFRIVLFHDHEELFADARLLSLWELASGQQTGRAITDFAEYVVSGDALNLGLQFGPRF